jgi:hypothetical protein
MGSESHVFALESKLKAESFMIYPETMVSNRDIHFTQRSWRVCRQMLIMIRAGRKIGFIAGCPDDPFARELTVSSWETTIHMLTIPTSTTRQGIS